MRLSPSTLLSRGRRLLAALGVAGFVAGCAGANGDAEPAADAEDQTSRTYAYVDVNPDNALGATAQTKLQAALRKLESVAKRGKSAHRRALAAETLARIEAGDVLLGSIEGSRGIDRWHMCRDYELEACKGAPPPANDRTWRGDGKVKTTLERELAGYMWGNRLYFTLTNATDPNELAATLVHETNHILNRSECHYYANIDTHAVDANHAYLEEFRAFLSECYFTHDTEASIPLCTKAARASTDGYGFDATVGDLEKVAAAVVGSDPDGPTALSPQASPSPQAGPSPQALSGRLVPRKRDFPVSFGACAAR